jgi:SAM-dependent methyltransferase
MPHVSKVEHGLFWRIYAAVYDRMWDSPLTDALADEIARNTAQVRTVVDLGCGTGLATAKVEGLVIGIDSSPTMIRRARCRVSDLRLAQAYDTGLEAGSADAVVLANVLHLCTHPERVMAEARRIAGPAGRIIITWPTAEASINAVAQVQRMLGWQAHRVALFIGAGLMTGIMGASIGLTRRSDEEVRGLIAAACGSDASAPVSLHGIQNIVQVAGRRQEASEAEAAREKTT